MPCQNRKPLEAPVEPAPRPAESAPTTQSPAAPNGLADPGRPTTPGGRHDAPPAPAAGPHEPLSTPPSGPHDPLSGPHDPAPGPAAPAEQLKSTSPLRAGTATTHMPVPSAGSSVEPAHAAVRLPQPSSSVPYAAPHASSPHFTPSDGRPAELTTMHGDDPYRHGHGDRPHQLPPHDGSPHGPDEVDPSELDPPEPPAEDEASGRQDDQPVEPAEPPIADPEDAGEIRHAISGHGSYFPAHGHIHVPRGTTITVYGEHGSSISDALGNLIETGGDTSGVYSKIFRPGDPIPDYTIYPPDGLNIMGTPQTVLEPTRLGELINEDMGSVDLAVCPYDATCPTGKVYDVDGIFDEWTGIFQPYERYGF